jgi:hypothetical protein
VFEFAGESDVDNPAVPSTVSIGLAPYPYGGHGLILSHLIDEVAFVALPIDVAALPRQVYPVTGNTYARVPRARILDVVSLLTPHDYSAPACPQLVHHNFDRYRARMIRSSYPVGPVTSVSRRVALIRPDGRKVLQHTRSTNADFFVGSRSPGRLP